MSTWYHVNNKISDGTKFPSELAEDAWEAIQDEQRFLSRLQRYPGMQRNGFEAWTLWKDEELVGELSISRMPPEDFPTPFQMMRGRGALQEGLEQFMQQQRGQPLLGFTVHMDPLEVLPLYNYMKRAFPGLVIGKDESTLWYDAEAWEKWAKDWLAGGPYDEQADTE